MLIRQKRVEDIPEFTLLVNRVWNETYRGIIDDKFLDNLENTIDDRIKRQTENFSKKDNYSYVLEENNKLIGYTSVGKSSDEDFVNEGELLTIYLLKEYQGKGYGRILFNHSVNKLKELGYKKYIICCLNDNPTNEFYKKMGGRMYNQKFTKMGGQRILRKLLYI